MEVDMKKERNTSDFLKETSTWRAIIILAGLVGINVESFSEHIDIIGTILAGLYGLINLFRKEK
jgi:hypothetical protein